MNPSMKTIDQLIEENIKKIYCNQQLEYTEYTSPPDNRPWMSNSVPIESEPSCIFSVMSYNVLSSSYAAPEMYPYCPKEYLDWETRGQSIIDEINYYECDVICLQEVELEVFLQFFLPTLETKGYDGVFAPKSRANTMSDTKRRLVDGCAIFWKTGKFTLVSQQLIEFNQLAVKNNAGCKDMLNRVMPRDNIGLFAVLKTTAAAWQDGLPKNSSDVDQLILVANTHLHWNPEFCDVKVLQSMMLAREIARMLETVSSLSEQEDNKRFTVSDIKLLLCGDFNSKTDSGVYEFLTKGQLAMDHPDFQNLDYKKAINTIFGNPESAEVVHHSLNLLSACPEENMPYTNYTYDFKAMIDFVFYGKSNMKPIGYYGPIDDQWFQENRIVGCPNQYIPSDHFPLVVYFKMVT